MHPHVPTATGPTEVHCRRVASAIRMPHARFKFPGTIHRIKNFSQSYFFSHTNESDAPANNTNKQKRRL